MTSSQLADALLCRARVQAVAASLAAADEPRMLSRSSSISVSSSFLRPMDSAALSRKRSMQVSRASVQSRPAMSLVHTINLKKYKDR